MKRLNIILKIICLIGCTFQLIDISRTYFEYSVITEVTLILDNYFKVPTFSICYYKHEIIDFQKYIHDYHLNVKTSNYIDLLDDMKVFDIHKYTVNKHDLLEECHFRNSESKLINYSGDKCNEMFNFNKYIINDYLCFDLMPV